MSEVYTRIIGLRTSGWGSFYLRASPNQNGEPANIEVFYQNSDYPERVRAMKDSAGQANINTSNLLIDEELGYVLSIPILINQPEAQLGDITNKLKSLAPQWQQDFWGKRTDISGAHDTVAAIKPEITAFLAHVYGAKGILTEAPDPAATVTPQTVRQPE